MDPKTQELKHIMSVIKYNAASYRLFIELLESEYAGEEKDLSYASKELFQGKKLDNGSLASIKELRLKILKSQTVLEQHGRREQEFGENSYLFHAFFEVKFYKADLTAFHHEREQRGWHRSPQGILSWLQARQRSLEQSHVVHGDVTKPRQAAFTMSDTVQGAAPLLATARSGDREEEEQEDEEDKQLLEQDADELTVQKVLVMDTAKGNSFRRIPECDFKGTPPCMTNHLLKNCTKFIAMTDKERVQHLKVVNRCNNCFSTEHWANKCTSKARCGNGQCGAKHNTLVHGAWNVKEVKWALTMLTPRAVLLTTKIFINSVRKWEGAVPLNVVADNGATFSILDKRVADAINMKGVTKPILMSTFGKDTPTTTVEGSVFLYTTGGKLVGKTTVNLVEDFVEIEAHDWTKTGRLFQKF
jgi:hypothetical protein